MGSQKKLTAPPLEDQNKSTKFTAFNAIPIYGSTSGMTVRSKDFTFNTQVMLFIQGLLMHKAGEISIKTIKMIWCPLVEPGALSSINMTVKYDVGDEDAEVLTDQTVLKVCGRISEYIVVTIRPSVPIIKDSDKAFYNPWTLDVDADDVSSERRNYVLGMVKIWCNVRIRPFYAKNRTAIKEHKALDVSWTNINYPYYVPYFIQRNVRGLGSVLWRDTEQYKSFVSEIVVHLDSSIVKKTHHLYLMQIMSKADMYNLADLTKTCHQKQGGTCTCNDMPTKYVASMISNNTGACKNHMDVFDNYCTGILTGKIKNIDEDIVVKF